MKIDTNSLRTVRPHSYARVSTLDSPDIGCPVRPPQFGAGNLPSVSFKNDDTGIHKDEQILNQVRQVFQHSGYAQLHRVRTYCHHGRVILQGRIPTYFLKQVAQELAGNVSGVREIDNDLQVVCSR